MNNYDWPYIRARYESGESAYKLSKGNGPAKNTIVNRAKREGWVKADQALIKLTEGLPSVQRALMHANSKRTVETADIICDMLIKGNTLKIAAQTAGIHPETLGDWRRDDPEFRRLTDRCRASHLATAEQVIHKTMLTDWNAAKFVVQHAPETRELYGKGNTDSKMQITINIDRGDGVVIEGETV